jgi:hypothetical protein
MKRLSPGTKNVFLCQIVTRDNFNPEQARWFRLKKKYMFPLKYWM